MKEVPLTMKASRKQRGGVWPLVCSLLNGVRQDLRVEWSSTGFEAEAERNRKRTALGRE